MFRLQSEWAPQSGVQMNWPDEMTPWEGLEDVQACYVKIIEAISGFTPLLLLCHDTEAARETIGKLAASQALSLDMDRILFCQCDYNDTWARDHGGIAVWHDGAKLVYDFLFNGWGLKFASDKDNVVTRALFAGGIYDDSVAYADMMPFVLEGGSIDCDGAGTLLTTSSCLCSVNRNEYMDRDEIEEHLKNMFGLSRVLWLDHGAIEGDDTDGHIDTLAKFVSEDTIVYSACSDPSDARRHELDLMLEQLRSFRTASGESYKLVPLYIPKPMYLDGYRLPATYTNFLISNGGVIVPVYGSDSDSLALKAIESVFPDKRLVPVDCRPLLSGHGSLHCVTMNYPEGFLKI